MSEFARGPVTPILLKAGKDLPWPRDERLFYVLGRDGLFMCRDHEFFRSCVPAAAGPSELEPVGTFLKPAFPRIPQDLFERVVGFFDRIAELHSSEAAVLLLWDRQEERVRIVVPDQVATVSRGFQGRQYGIGVEYTPPAGLPPHWVPFGDVHCHVWYPAYASHIDKEDELHSAGLHIVVGKIDLEPPDLHAEVVVDGVRFSIDVDRLVDGYAKRDRDVPEEWIDQVRVEVAGSWSSYSWTPERSS